MRSNIFNANYPSIPRFQSDLVLAVIVIEWGKEQNRKPKPLIIMLDS